MTEYAQQMGAAIEGDLSPEEQVDKIINIQKPRLKTIEKDLNTKRTKNLRNILVTGVSTLILGAVLADATIDVAKAKMLNKMDSNTRAKIELATDQTGGGKKTEELPATSDNGQEIEKANELVIE